MKADVIYFWGRGKREWNYRWLSQWWSSRFAVDGIVYPTAEHFMMAAKARLFNDVRALTIIMGAERPSVVKEAGRQVRNFSPTVWERRKVAIVYAGNRAKFSQSAELKRKLLKTGNALIVESSPEDPVWGVGLRSSDRRIVDPAKWRGSNLLGFILMAVRKELQCR